MDYDIEMEDAALEAYPPVEDIPPVDDILPVDDVEEPGEVDESADAQQDEKQELVPNKIHIRGLEAFEPKDVESYLKEHSGGSYERIEWIDDSSANLIFRSPGAASDAIIALSDEMLEDPTQLAPLQLLRAKKYSAKTDADLQVRLAVVADRKLPGAAARSRFYLFHPEYDPEERRRRGDFDRRRYRDRDGESRYDRRGGGGRGGGGRWRSDRRDDDVVESFDASLYDDDEAALAKRASRRPAPRRRSRSRSASRSTESSGGRYARRNREKELFPDRSFRERDSFSLRNRSASPQRSASRGFDDRDRVVDEERAGRGAASRNRDKARSIKERLSKDNSTKELFPSKAAPARSSGRLQGVAQMDQVDTTAVTTRLSGMSVFSYDGSSEYISAADDRAMAQKQGRGLTRKLADRITRPSETGGGIHIRGIASQRGSADPGFTIKGSASARELFPEKLNGNAEKELFADKLENRIRRRQRAEDLFH